MKINYAMLHNINETHISFEAIRPSGEKVSERDFICKADKICKQKKISVRIMLYGVLNVCMRRVCDG